MWQVSDVMVKLAGAIMLAFGIGAATLAAWVVERQIALDRRIEMAVVVFVLVLVPLAVFGSLAGYRLLFNRPTRHGSTLTPYGWKVVAGFFWISGLGFAGLVVARGEYAGLVAAAGLGALGYCCLLAARDTPNK